MLPGYGLPGALLDLREVGDDLAGQQAETFAGEHVVSVVDEELDDAGRECREVVVAGTHQPCAVDPGEELLVA